MEETGVELPKVTEVKEEIHAEQPKEGFLNRVRRVLSGKSNVQSETPKAPELTLDEQIAQNELSTTQLAAEAKNIVDRSLGDMTLEDRRMATSKQAELENAQRIGAELRARAEVANQATQSPTVEQPTAIPVVSNEPATPVIEEPKEEPAAA